MLDQGIDDMENGRELPLDEAFIKITELRNMRRQLMKLQTMGSIFGKTSIIYQNYSIYKKLFLPSIIFYIIKEKQKEIHILRVLRSERNWKKILHQQSNYTYPDHFD